MPGTTRTFDRCAEVFARIQLRPDAVETTTIPSAAAAGATGWPRSASGSGQGLAAIIENPAA